MTGTDLSKVEFDTLISREWLSTNKLGGYACATVPGLNSRKYHGLLVAAMSPPVRRMVLLSKVEETVTCDGWPVALSCNEYPGTIHPQGHQALAAFNAWPFPRWGYQNQHWTILKELRLLKGENTVVITYTLVTGDKPVELQIRPLFALRGIHELTYQWNGLLNAEKLQPQHGGRRLKSEPKNCKCKDWRIPATSRTPEVFFTHDGEFRSEGVWYLNTIYRCEEDRGYSGLEDLWNPGIVRWTLKQGQSVHFICSADSIDLEKAIDKADRQYAPNETPTGVHGGTRILSSPDEDADAMDMLLRASDQFVIETAQEMPANVTVMSQYPWSAPGTRAGLAGFTGLFLVPGKFAQGKAFLQRCLAEMKNGLVPSEFDEAGAGPVFNAADLSLWLVNAIAEYLRYTNDEKAMEQWFNRIVQIIDIYRAGTDLGVGVDEEGLVCSDSPGWMDAKTGNWVVTPRKGRGVELNALWYNALRIAASLAARVHQDAKAPQLNLLADKVRDAFNRRFWNDDAQCCFDVVGDEANDSSIRPNQLLAISLPFAVLSIDRHEKVLARVTEELLTPVGLRSLSPDDPAYQAHYRGGVVERDRAQHQGSVHPWLLGPFVDAYLKINGRGMTARRQVRRFVDALVHHVRTRGDGLVPELFDGQSPHRAGGAIASALSTAELLRVYAEAVLELTPERTGEPGKIATVDATVKHDVVQQ